MDLLIGSIRYSARRFRLSPVFTTAAVLTVALGIGGTTAIFTLIDAVMLRPLPVADPAGLYRVGDGDDTIAQGRHGRWGFFSFPLYEELKAGAPEFEDIIAFDWGGNRLSVRAQGITNAARPVLARYVTGTYFATLGVGAFRGRVFVPDDDRPSAPPLVVLSHHAWRGAYGADPSVVGSKFVVEGHPFTVIGVAAPGFFGETVRANPPDIWIPLLQEPMIAGGGSLLHQSIPSWLAVIGRLRRGASIAGMDPRLTGILRRWIQYDAGYPSNWMPDIIRDLPNQSIRVVPAGSGIGLGGLSVKEQYGPSAGAHRAGDRSGNEHQDFGYKVQGRVVVGLNRPPSTYTPQQLSSLYRDIEQRLAGLPGVRGAGLAQYNPLTSNWSETILVAGHPPNGSDQSSACWDRVSANYLQNLGVTIMRGRLFTAADNETTAPVAVVNEAFVKRFFKDNEDPLDQHFGFDPPEYAGTFRIVGIVRDAKFAVSALTRPARPMFYVPLAQRVDYKTDYRKMAEEVSHFIQGIMLVTDSPVGALEPLLRRTLAEADPNLTITSVRTVQQLIDVSFGPERAVASLAELFGIVALVLAAVGVYGVMAYMVARQMNQIGIRMALGADRAKVLRMILGRAFQRMTAGLVVGLPLAVGAARFLAAELNGVSFWDPFALTVAAGALAGCTFLAAIIPAARAAAISPMAALRTE